LDFRHRIALATDSDQPENFAAVFGIAGILGASELAGFGILKKVTTGPVATLVSASRTAGCDFVAGPSELLQAAVIDLCGSDTHDGGFCGSF
jgi:hypothetical protein